MIDFIRGVMVHRTADSVVLDVNGVGYHIFVSQPFAPAFVQHEELTLYTHHHVREDAMLLYGFESRDEQTLFRRLIEVSGIGPKVALGMLSGARPDQMIAAIQREDIGSLTRLPGIGKKTAQRVVLDLKDKLKELSEAFPESAVIGQVPGAAEVPSGTDWDEAKAALMALGFSEPETDRAWTALQADLSDEETTETLMKKALKILHA